MPISGLVVTLKPTPTGHPPRPATIHGGKPAYRESPEADSFGMPADSSTTSPEYAAIIEQIQQHPNFQAGLRQGQRLPVVLDTPDKQTDKQCWGWVNELPGVHHVDVAFIHFEDEDAIEASPCNTRADELIAAPTIGET